MIIKVCGLTEKANILAIDALSIDLIGMIFYEKSARFVERFVEKNTKAIADIPATNAPKVGVFVNSSVEYILEKIKKYKLQYVQLHGTESDYFIHSLYYEIIDSNIKNVKLIKVFSIDSQKDSEIDNRIMAFYARFCEYFLFDTKGKKYGGTGVKFDWKILESYTLETPFLLSGGISVDDIDEIKSIKHPQFAGIDINSKFEIKAGLKNIEKIKNFIEKL